ncbi:HEPN-associated N-terminal domain-containing protein [Delftia acidovorans]|uniref:HEPN-associated N-terminal domain-containing protein n=1 Tax=Delftia acidovorans TaxID=80866 RepID=UPI0035A0C339
MDEMNVCAACFGDSALRAWVREEAGPRGCSFCGRHFEPTVTLAAVARRIQSSVQRYYGRAADILYYESANGGYLGSTWDNEEILEKMGLWLKGDEERLRSAIVGEMEEELWCEKDPGALGPGEALSVSWANFCRTVKHKRRFFFHATGEDDRDSYTPSSLLETVADACDHLGLVGVLDVGQGLWRARVDLLRNQRARAPDFGPPPVEFAVQSNRMNPPGIPMLYLASTQRTALAETKSSDARVGKWRVMRPLRVLDLRALPIDPGPFAEWDPHVRATVSFIHEFAAAIMQPVARDDRVNIEYLPSQVATEFFRDYVFSEGRIDGIVYRSTVHRPGWNVALFLDLADLGLEQRSWGRPRPLALAFEKSAWVRFDQ